jgi:hypothetical protein
LFLNPTPPDLTKTSAAASPNRTFCAGFRFHVMAGTSHLGGTHCFGN